MNSKYKFLKKLNSFNKSHLIYRFLFLAVTFSYIISFTIGCKKLVEVDPPITSTNGPNVYASDDIAASVLTNIYAKMSQIGSSNNATISTSFFSGLSSDELTLYTASTNTTYNRYYMNALSTTPVLSANLWTNYYPVIFVANSAIEGLGNSTTLTPLVKQELMGEAKFMRAFCYFYLVNLYGDVPLVTGTDYTISGSLPRTPKSLVWDQIIVDLTDAQNGLSDNYLNADVKTTTGERVRPIKWAATALLARAYLYTGDYAKAEAQATTVINNASLYSLNTLNTAFLANSNEAIWQLQPVNTGWNTEDARVFILTGAPSATKPVYLSPIQLSAFEAGDQRKVNWTKSITVGSTTYIYPNKYKSATQNLPVTEYAMVLRLAEQYLIRSEARAQQNNISGAQIDLNAIRNRASLGNTTANDRASLLTAILHERQVELFTEWGHRWFDLKRTGNIDAVMNAAAPQKGGIWNTNAQWYPIPLLELQRNPYLVQNAGY